MMHQKRLAAGYLGDGWFAVRVRWKTSRLRPVDHTGNMLKLHVERAKVERNATNCFSFQQAAFH